VSVATHLGIALDEYDARIRTFIPDYETMLDVAARAVPAGARTIVDLGIGTGALAARCLAQARGARLIGIDADRDILVLADRRLGTRGRLMAGNFLRADIPASDVIVASFALHHVRTRRAKAALYRRAAAALRRGGRCITVDCHPASDRTLARAQMAMWDAHLRRSYSAREARRLLAAWAREDRYVPLRVECELMRRAGLRVEVLWRKDAFAVLAGTRLADR
jgi:ubiquinone/menaquinone biosynthesis C-methylase UbiE